MPESFRSPASLSRFILTAVIGVTLDLWVKWMAFQKLVIAIIPRSDGTVIVVPKEPYRLIPGWLEFEAVPNWGAVFGVGQGHRFLFVFVSVCAVAFLFYLFATSGRRIVYQLTLGILLAGVLGNLYDRMMLGYVRDMIHILPRWPHLFQWVFNIADTLLCTGVGAMILFSLGPAPKKERSPQSDPGNA